MATASYTAPTTAARRAAWDATRAARMAGLDPAAARKAASDAARAAFRAVELSEVVAEAVAVVDRYLPSHLREGRDVSARWSADARAALEEVEVAELRARKARKNKLARGMALTLRG